MIFTRRLSGAGQIKVQERHLLLLVLGELAAGKRPSDYLAGR